MKVEIDSKKENVLHKRTEVIFTAEHGGEPTPKRSDLRAGIADKLGVNKDRVVIDHTNSEFGIGRSHGYAKVYETGNWPSQARRTTSWRARDWPRRSRRKSSW